VAEEWERTVARPENACLSCNGRFGAGDPIIACLSAGEEGLQRQDRCPDCFEALEVPPFSFWRMRWPDDLGRGPQKLDLAYLTEFFKRLQDQEDQEAGGVLWIVALLLLRKKILVLEGRRQEEGREILRLRLKREDRAFDVGDPQLTDDALAGLHEDLARIFKLEEAT